MTLSEWFEQNKDKEIEFDGDSIKIKKTESKVWIPGYREEFFYIDEGCDICSDQWFGWPTQQRQLQIGNVFEFESEAKRAKEYLEFYQQLRELGGRPYFDSSKENWTLVPAKIGSENRLAAKTYRVEKPGIGTWYFDSEHEVEKAGEKLGMSKFWDYFWRKRESETE